MKNSVSILIFVLFGFLGIGQNLTPTSQSNYSLNFTDFLSGVKYAEIYTTKELEDYFITNPNSSGIYMGVADFLEYLGFEEVGFSSKFRNYNLPSECDKVIVILSYHVNGSWINDFKVRFLSCSQDYWDFERKYALLIGDYNSTKSMVFLAMKNLYGYKKPYYSKYNRIKLSGPTTNWNEISLKQHLIVFIK